jgi:putative nucleotidyltransferase with HDIG domain
MNQPDQDIRQRLLAARLPAMPQILLKLLELCQADGAGMAEIAKLVANDAAMSTKVLQVANSAAYQRGGQKAGLMQALGALGSDMIKTLVINESVLQAMGGFAGSAHTDLRGFWKHALATAVMAREIARATDYALPEEAYLAGLLHDVGRLALLAAVPERYAPHFQADDDDALCALEQRSLQLSHAEAGAWVVQQWELDSFLADAVLYHHEPAYRLEGAHALIRAVHLAHQLANHNPEQPLAAEAGALCRLSGDRLLGICQTGVAQVQKAAGILGVDLSGVADWAAPSAQASAPARADPAQLRLNEEVRDLTLLNAFGQSLALSDAAQSLVLMRQQAQLVLGVSDAAVFVADSEARQLVCAAYSQAHQRLAGFTISLSAGGVIADAARQPRVDYLGRQPGVQSVADEQLLRIFNADFLLCVPLVHQAQCLGMLVGAVAAWQVAELQQRERFVAAFGAQAARALQTGRSTPGDAEQRLQALRQQQIDNARRVVHEVNNPLAIIKNYLEVLDDKLARQEPVVGELGVLHEEIDRIGHIMGEFAGTAPLAPVGTTDINKAVNKLVRLLRESKFLPATVELSVRLPQQTCVIDGPADTLTQILVNLVKNAVEALPKGGRVEIVNNGQVQRNGRFFYALCVSDNGPGIAAEHRGKLFTPVQSSKPGSNRGLGLSIVQGLVTKLGGTIACVSTTAQGTMFEICLPLPAALAQLAVAPAVQDFV